MFQTETCNFTGAMTFMEISNNAVCATSKASDQPAHMRSLIRAFASRLRIFTCHGSNNIAILLEYKMIKADMKKLLPL